MFTLNSNWRYGRRLCNQKNIEIERINYSIIKLNTIITLLQNTMEKLTTMNIQNIIKVNHTNSTLYSLCKKC